MLLILGLGNPGEEYVNTRHNLGFMFLDKIKKKFSFPEYKEKFIGFISNKKILNNNVLLLKPKTFMNLSGNSLEQVIKFYKLSIKNIIVIHDDLDLELAKIRIKQNGGHGGHNGIKNIISKIGNDFTRIKIGIKSIHKVSNPKDYVLEKFNKIEQKEIDSLLDKLAHNFDFVLQKEFAKLLNKISIK